MDARLTLTGHVSDLGGGFVVRRMLPAARRQSVGPFIFFDHFGPLMQAPGAQTDVRPHPHIGLATVTYLFDGAMMHRDSLGSVQRIEPGAINWMTAGRGIVHSERTPDDLRHVTHAMHGLQLWVALPQAMEEMAPSFVHTEASAIPEVALPGCRVRVLVGEGWQARSPVEPASPTLYLDVSLAAGATLELPALATEMAIYTVDQPLQLGDQPNDQPNDQLSGVSELAVHTMTMLDGAARIHNPAPVPARCVVIGGEPLDGPRFIWWNFVASEKAKITRAADDWAAGLFARVPGEVERIELPARRPW